MGGVPRVAGGVYEVVVVERDDSLTGWAGMEELEKGLLAVGAPVALVEAVAEQLPSCVGAAEVFGFVLVAEGPHVVVLGLERPQRACTNRSPQPPQ